MLLGILFFWCKVQSIKLWCGFVPMNKDRTKNDSYYFGLVWFWIFRDWRLPRFFHANSSFENNSNFWLAIADFAGLPVFAQFRVMNLWCDWISISYRKFGDPIIARYCPTLPDHCPIITRFFVGRCGTIIVHYCPIVVQLCPFAPHCGWSFLLCSPLP